MEKDFDPYYKWLSIPPAEQPPNHYRLLGVPLYTSDPDVIENAADRQMAHIRRLAVGKHAELSQKVLNELAAVRGCLLDAKQKANYDVELRRQIAAATPTQAAIPVARALPIEPAAASIPKQLKTRSNPQEATVADSTFEFAADDGRPSATTHAGRLRRRQRGPSVLLIGILLLAVAAAGFGLWRALRKPTDSDPLSGGEVVHSNDSNLRPPNDRVVERISPRPADELPQQRSPDSSDWFPDESAADPSTATKPKPPSSVAWFGEDEKPTSPDNSLEGSLTRADAAVASFNTQSPSKNDPLKTTEVASRRPLPSPSELEPALQRVREIFGISTDGDLANRLAAENITDAEEMLRQANNSSEPLEVRCALLLESLRLSLAALHAESVTKAVETLRSRFETDGWSLVAAAAATLPASDDEARKAQAEFFLQLVPTCQAAEVYRPGLQLAEAAQEAVSGKARRVIDPTLRKQASEQIELLQGLAELHDAYQSARETLENPTGDESEQAAAQLAAGQYLVFIREDWKTGCEHLAKGSDARLATAAQADLEGQQSDQKVDPTAAKKRGDLWFDFGQRGKPYMRLPSLRRASHWYTLAFPALKGRDQQSVEKRLAELDRELGPASQYLADLPPLDSRGRTEVTGRLEFIYEGERMHNSLWTNPTGREASYVTFALDRKFVGLRGEVSIDDTARDKIQSDLIFTIFGDGRVLWRSPPTGKSQLKTPFEVSVKNVQTLTVQCECTGSEGYVHGVWLEPLLLRR